MIRAVCFDFGGVYRKHRIGEDDWRKMWRNKQKEIGKGFPYLFFVGMLDKLDRGKISLNEFNIGLLEYAGKKYSEEDLVRLNRPVLGKIVLNRRIRGLVLSLKKKGYAVPLVSNSIKEVIRIHKSKNNYSIFSPLFISAETGLSKSDGSLFKFVLRKLKLKPSECVMIDDKRDFLRQARKLGIRSILYRNPDQLEKDLKKAGVG